MDFSERMGRYCERFGPGFWDEPFNAISNIAFIIAALAGFWLWRKRGGRDLPVLLLIVVAFSVGVGSFMFHTHATQWSWFADVIPIAIFIAGYLFLALYRFAGISFISSLLLVAAFEAVTVLTLRFVPPAFLNRAAGYFLALFALILVGAPLFFHKTSSKAQREAGRGLLIAAVLFAISLFMRTIDIYICAAIPIGTHFLWHVFNALVIFVLLRTAILHGPGKARGKV